MGVSVVKFLGLSETQIAIGLITGQDDGARRLASSWRRIASIASCSVAKPVGFSVIAIAPLHPVGPDNDDNNRNPQRDDGRASDGRQNFGDGHVFIPG